ncbi:MAG: NUDIX pyrophosphatase [Candidatus Diapherotrites archaeon]|jgi:dihydroneopterin triphosphate diphosphatase|nr:NUDIX pyrophosphatase [Candidatus Diapherotrites archaeon]MBT4596583.1 NUDIX pyrophosphatase [Candidatus Diapherotrites archaeon]
MKPRLVECIVFRKKKNIIEFLLLKRIPKKGGFWQPITGGVEETDKSLIEAAYRELKEEANIPKTEIIKVFENIHYFEMNNHYLTREPAPLQKEFVFAFEITPEFIISLDKNIYQEHTKFKWVSFEEALQLLKWEDNKDAFRKLNKILNGAD